MSKNCIARILPLFLLGTALSAQQVQVRINDNLSSATAEAGTTFDGSLVNAVSLNGRTCAKGSTVLGRVTDAKPSGRLSDPGVLEIELTSIQCSSGRNYAIAADRVRLEGKSHTKRNATLIGGGAVAGAILGGLIGGGKGAAIGAGVGAGTGTVGAAAGGKKEAEIESEAIVAWNVTSATEEQSSRRYRDGRERDRDRDGYDRRDDYHPRYDRDRDGWRDDDYRVFSERQRDRIRACLDSSRSGLPPGLAKKDRLPPGLEKQIQRNGTLPPGLEKKVQGLPYACSDELPNIPGGWERVILSGRILLLDRERRIIDLFFLAE